MEKPGQFHAKCNYHLSMPLSRTGLLCYSASSWQRLGVSASAQLEIFVVKLGSTCENKTDLKSCQRPTEILLFSKYHCTTLTVELELDVSICAQLKIFTHKTASHGLILQKLCILGPITCHRLTLKGKYFCIAGKSSRKS